MSTMEHLFMQIFSRKRSIEDQFKHQVDSYGENLASNLLSEGLRPPPWLWISRSLCPNPGELNREQLISEILDQHPWATTPAKSNNVRDLKKTNVNLFSNFKFPEQDPLSKFIGVKNRDECVSKDVPENSMQNSETGVEVEFMEKQFTNSSVSHNDTNNRCSKRAKTLDNLVEEYNFPEFTGRVTRSMSADKKSSCVNHNNSVRRSRSQGHNCQSLDPPSIMTESQGIANIAQDGSEVNECILDGLAAYTAEDGCQLTNTLSSRLSAISLLPGPDIHFAEIIECDESPVSKFDQENIKDAEILNYSRTISRIEESHIDSAKEQDGFIEIAHPLSSIRTPCKTFEKTPASDRNADECHANSKEAISSTGITNKSESKPVVERKELYSNVNPIADSDIFCTAFNHNGDESAYTSETDVQVIGSNANISLPLTDHLHGTGYDSSLSIGNMLNSFKNFTVQPTLVQNVVMEGSNGEKYTGQVANEVIEVRMQDKSTDPSAEKDAERSSSLSILSRNDFKSPSLNSEGKITLKEFGSVEERMTPDAKKNCKSVQTRYLLRSSTSHDKQHSASSFSVTTDSCNLKESVDKGHDNTWPKQKINKNQFTNALNTSPRLRVKTHKHHKPVNCTGKKSSDYISRAIFESQSTMASQNTEVELPEAVSGSQFQVKQISNKPQTSKDEQESIGKYHASDEDQEANVGEECFSINADCNVPDFDKCSLGKVCNSSPFKLGEYEEQHGSSTLSGITKSCYLKESMDEGHDNTWPKRKRNRSQFNVLGTSPWLRVELHKHKKPVNSIGKKSSANISGAIFESQPAITSQNTEVEIPEAVSRSQIQVEQISKKPRNSEGEQELRGKYRASDDNQEVNIGEECFGIITDCNVPNLDKRSLEKVIKNNPSNLDKREESMIKSKAQDREGISHNVHGSSIFSEHHEDVVVNLDEDLPDEGFAIDIAPIIADGIITTDSKISSLSEERASLLEQLCKSGSMLTMESCPLDNNIQNIPDVHQFSLADVLEQTNFSCHDNWSDKDQPSSSKNVRTTEKFPSTPPIETSQQRKMRKSFASGEEHVSNPDYVCFRIDENSSVSQEETTSDHVINSNEVCRSPNITVLADVTSKYRNIMPNTDSVSRKYSEKETFDSVKPKSRLKADSKENINLEGKLSHVTNRTGSLQRVSSAKSTNRNIVKSSFEKCKPNNIVSNISSFIPLVKEKQQTTTHALGKRDIKVKALEAAEAAKRLEEKKQEAREMKKAAAKLERMRLEQESIRQLEVMQKQKEELRRKKEADVEAKKRQRVSEKAEKERKRRCTEETRRHQRANDKNIQDKNEDVKKRKRKEISKGVKKLTKSENGMKAACRVSRDTTSVVSKAECDDRTHVINSVNTHGALSQVKAVDSSCKLQNPIQDRMSVTAENRELSYEISPCKDTDDEDGDDDYARRKKFVPSWARKESVNLSKLANRHLNPDAVFSRKRSFDILKVLAPKVNRRPLP